MCQNNWKYYAERGFMAMSHILMVGTVLQTNLMEQGVGEQAVSNITAILQLVQMGTMLTLSSRIEKVSNVIKYYGLTALAQILLHLVLMYYCINHKISVDTKYGMILVIGVVVNVFYGINSILTYKLPYHVLDMSQYGKIMAKSGIISGLAGTGFSALLAFFAGKYDYYLVMAVFFGIGALFMVVSAAIIFSYVPLGVKQTEQRSEHAKSIFSYRIFRIFCIPDFLRGFAGGIYGVVTVIGYHYGVLNLQTSSILPVIIQTATIAGCLLYSKIVNEHNNRHLILLASMMMLVFMPAMLLGHSTVMFCAMYVIVSLAYTVVNYSVPVRVTEIVDYEYIGQYSAWRMLLHTAGTAFAAFASTYMLEWFGGFLTMLLAGAAQCICGVVYFLFNKETGHFPAAKLHNQ